MAQIILTTTAAVPRGLVKRAREGRNGIHDVWKKAQYCDSSNEDDKGVADITQHLLLGGGLHRSGHLEARQGSCATNLRCFSGTCDLLVLDLFLLLFPVSAKLRIYTTYKKDQASDRLAAIFSVCRVSAIIC